MKTTKGVTSTYLLPVPDAVEEPVRVEIVGADYQGADALDDDIPAGVGPVGVGPVGVGPVRASAGAGTHGMAARGMAAPRNGVRYRILAYLRVSHDRSADNHTFETQLQRIREKLDTRYGRDNYDLEVLQDEGISGFYGPTATGVEKRTRPTLVVVESKIMGGDYDCFAVYKLNRLFRNTRWTLQWIDDVLLPSGVNFVSATEDIDLHSSQGRTMLTMIATMDESMREATAERIRDAQASRVENGFLLGPPPFGWMYQNRADLAPGQRRGIEPNPAEVAHVLYMKEKYLAGWGSEKIAHELNKRQVPTALRSSQWQNPQILKVLRNPVHAGYVRSGRKGLIKGQHYEQRFYELADVEAINEARSRRNRRGKTSTLKADQPHLVNGIAHCARCGNRLYIYTGSQLYRAYRCQTGRGVGPLTCPHVTVRAQYIEDVVVAEIERLSQEPAMRQLLRAAAAGATDIEDEALRNEQAHLQRVRRGAQERLENLLHKLGDGVIGDDDFKLMQSKIKPGLEAAEARLLEIEADLAQRCRREQWAVKIQQAVLDFPLCWEHLNREERRELISTLVETLTLDRSGRDAIVRLKVHLLPERTVPICFESMKHMKDRPLGVLALTRRQLAVLHYVGEGKSLAEMAELMGITIATPYSHMTQIRKCLGVRSIEEAYRMAKGRIEELRETLDLGPSGLGRVHTGDTPVMCDTLSEVLPYLSQGASVAEVAAITGLTVGAVKARRARILDLFRAGTIYEAAQKARAQGLLQV